MNYNSVTTLRAHDCGEFLCALAEVKKLRAGGVMQPLTIKLTDGVYELDRTVVLDESFGALTITSDGGAVFSGGRKITGFKKTNFNGKACFGAFIPEVKNGEWNFSDLYVDGLRADLTRYPVSGGFHKTDIENKGGQLFDGSTWFTAHPADLNDVSNITDCIVSFNHYWIDEHSPIRDYDPMSGRLTLEYKTRFNISGDIEYYLENVPQCFSEPNQWYLDRASGMLYYIPRDEFQTAGTIQAFAPVISKLFEIKGNDEAGAFARNIRFKNVAFAYTRGDYASGQDVDGNGEGIGFASDAQAVSNADGTISFKDAIECSVEDCRMINYGVHGFVIKEGCRSVSIRRCYIYDGGAGGVKIAGGSAGSPEWTMTSGCSVSDTVIRHCGRRYLSACGILIMNASENVIEHNEISDLLYTGISCGWVWGYAQSSTYGNLITQNHIFNLGQGKLSDMGGVYLLGLQPGTVVSNNLIHDIKSLEYGGWALYTDEGSSYITLENNVCYNCSDNAYHQHYGSFNVVRNNIFAFSKSELVRVSRNEEHLSIVFEGNIMFSSGSPVYSLSKEQFTEGRVGARDNIIWRQDGIPVISSGWGEGELDLEKVQSLGFDTGSVIADPGFADADNYNFELAPDSPAVKHGFTPIDVSGVGPRV